MKDEIFATAERQKVLDDFNIKYKVDINLNFVFETESEKNKAVKVLKGALEL